MRGREAWRRTLEVKERFLVAGDPDRLPPPGCGVRREIVLSWRRSLLSGVDAASRDLPRDESAVPPDRLVQAARPVVDRLADQLAGMRAWAFLADHECRLVRHVVGQPALLPQLEARGAFPGARFGEDVVGTNGLGTAVEQRGPFIVAGSEHFRAYESGATTAGAPVRDPVTRRLVGLLNVNCSYGLANGLLLPFVAELARSIEARLLAGAAAAERAVLEEFVRVSRCSRAVVALSGEVSIANAAALTLLDGADLELLRQWACHASPDGRERTARLLLRPDLAVTARCRPLSATRRRPAAVVVLAPSPAPVTVARRPPRSSSWERLLEQLAQVRAMRLPLLLVGERGTGKTVLARRLHDQTGATGPFTVLDAAAGAARPRDWLRRLASALGAPAGTVHLRRLDNLDPALVEPAASLLGSPRARLLATASERAGQRTDLAALVERFPVVLEVPPLRERVGDIPSLVNEIIAELRPQPPRPRCTPEALAALAGGEWPGNVRQLRQVVTTALVRSMSCDIAVDDLPGGLAAAGRARHLTRLERLERQVLVTALRDAAWDREAAARELGISRATIYRKLKRLGIHPPAPNGRRQTGAQRA
jgi:transcriptional regulator of acetoin/glycerol metabolism